MVFRFFRLEEDLRHVAWMQRSGIREVVPLLPDSASLHPGYGIVIPAKAGNHCIKRNMEIDLY
ncbi:hypothetical protein BN59_02449 [Legionella massiliensis]|uniref:Uncharacterized protein n=1 Tax=Legionella massiliensis TaxID=1034943 RepID=A0A078KYI9_9GAMM|nr:hypothetical protein BN59_02449 [Legionella massiliensis]CEE13880.1 hypothetical protein BN1094_02449 [Legionella massiliensis]